MYTLDDLWKESSGNVNSETFREFVRLSGRIDRQKKKGRTVKAALLGAAVAASLAAVAFTVFSITRTKYQVSPLDGTMSLVADYASTSSVTLPDGTEVRLNSGSTLLYPESFGKGSRIVYLTGEGNFYVAKDARRPFIVKTTHMDVQALGTTFNIKSFVGEKDVRTTLLEGKVKVTLPAAGGKSWYLEPGTQFTFSPEGNSVNLARVDARKVLGWEDGTLSFINAPFGEVVSALERKYGVSIQYNTEKMQKGALNVRFLPEETLDDALKVLALLIPGSRYKVDGSRVYWQF